MTFSVRPCCQPLEAVYFDYSIFLEHPVERFPLIQTNRHINYVNKYKAYKYAFFSVICFYLIFEIIFLMLIMSYPRRLLGLSHNNPLFYLDEKSLGLPHLYRLYNSRILGTTSIFLCTKLSI